MPEEPESRSVQRRKAIQRGEPMPTFEEPKPLTSEELDTTLELLEKGHWGLAQGRRGNVNRIRATLAAKDKRIQELETALRWIRADAKTNLNHLVEVIDREVGDA